MITHEIRNIFKNLFWFLYGRRLRHSKLPLRIFSILFACKGNICRSPFAEKYANIYYNKSNQYIISSAGIFVENQETSPEEAIIAAKLFGVDLGYHKSNNIISELMNSYDLIVVMETWQYKNLRNKYIKFKDKITLLPLFEINREISLDSYSQFNIRDPYGKSVKEFEECFKRIENGIAGLFHNININNYESIK